MNLKTLLKIAFLGLVASGLSAQEIPAVFKNLKAGKPQTVVLYGTSLTAQGAWAGALKEWFQTAYPKQVTVLNTAGPGQCSDWGLQNLGEKVLKHKPDLVFIEFSYNDAHEKFKMSLPKGKENLDAMVKAIHAQNPDTTIVLQIMNIGWDAPNGNRSLSVRPQLLAFNENYRVYAKEQELPLLDHFIAWNQLKETKPEIFQSLVSDGSHPTKEGSLLYTWPLVKNWLETARGN
jgi:lysophospholipase L1-like esterase